MISEARLNANRRNAQKSTGPKTEEGKRRASQNSTTHGLAGLGFVPPKEEAAELEKRQRGWARTLQPENLAQRWLVDQAAGATLQLDRCQAIDLAQRGRAARRAGFAWEVDRRIEADEIASRLASDPARAVNRLKATLQGCDWLLARWNGLNALLEHNGSWDETQHGFAMDLLGVPEHEREADVQAASAEALKGLVQSRIEELEGLKSSGLEEDDAIERSLAEQGIAFDTALPARLLRRYESAARRRFDRSLTLLKQLRGALRPQDGEDDDLDDEDDDAFARPAYDLADDLVEEDESEDEEADLASLLSENPVLVSLLDDDALPFSAGQSPAPEPLASPLTDAVRESIKPRRKPNRRQRRKKQAIARSRG